MIDELDIFSESIWGHIHFVNVKLLVKTLCLWLKNYKSELLLVYIVFSNPPFIDKWQTFTSTAGSPVVMTQIFALYVMGIVDININ